MSEASAQLPDAAAPQRPVSLWLWALFCAVVAVGSIPFSWWLKRRGFMPADASLFTEYRGFGGLLYFGGAACCAVLLMRQSRHAVSAALLVVAWLAYTVVRFSWAWLHGSVEPHRVLGPAVKLVVFALLLRYAVRQQRAGVLR